jgi:hypothetical protein
MVELALISLAFGVALAGRYQFLILGVVTFAGLVAIAAFSHATGLSLTSGLLAGLVFAICVQSGYLAGTLIFDLCAPLVRAPVPVRAQSRRRG